MKNYSYLPRFAGVDTPGRGIYYVVPSGSSLIDLVEYPLPITSANPLHSEKKSGSLRNLFFRLSIFFLLGTYCLEAL